MKITIEVNPDIDNAKEKIEKYFEGVCKDAFQSGYKIEVEE